MKKIDWTERFSLCENAGSRQAYLVYENAERHDVLRKVFA